MVSLSLFMGVRACLRVPVCVCVCVRVGACAEGVRFSYSNRLIPSDYWILFFLKMPIPKHNIKHIICHYIMFIAGYQFNTFSVINYDYVLLQFDKLKINLILIYAIHLISSINLLLYSGIHSVWYLFIIFLHDFLKWYILTLITAIILITLSRHLRQHNLKKLYCSNTTDTC